MSEQNNEIELAFKGGASALDSYLENTDTETILFHVGEIIARGNGSLRDDFAAKEKLAEYDHPDAIPSKRLCEALAGPQPEGGWGESGDIVEMFKWESKWRAALKYIRADAMIKERAKQ